ncbi:MAG: sugar ABC transporter substrate-binding protein [bacterium]|nr:sugar ABC transporter substrate-binding protein [bacterium]
MSRRNRVARPLGQPRRSWRFFALLAALSLVAFACGDGGESDAAEAEAAAAQAQAAAAQAEAEAAQADAEAAAAALAQAQADLEAAQSSAAEAMEGDEASQAALADAEAALAEAKQMIEEAMEPEVRGTIAFSYGNESSGIYPIVADPARLEAERRGYEWVEGSANGDCEKQVQDIEGFVAAGVDAIVFLPLCGIDPYLPVVQSAKDAGIVIVGYSTAIPGGDSSIVYANIAGARAVAAEALRWLEEDFTGDPETFSWALFTFDQCGTACTDRTDPIRQIITEATGVAPLEAESVAEGSGLEATETFLQADPGLNMVIGINDAGALGAYQAFVGQIESEGRDPGEIFVGGMDGQNEALELLAGADEYGIYRVSGALILDQLGKAVADLPANILEGQPPTSLVLNYVAITPGMPDFAQQVLDNYAEFLS